MAGVPPGETARRLRILLDAPAPCDTCGAVVFEQGHACCGEAEGQPLARARRTVGARGDDCPQHRTASSRAAAVAADAFAGRFTEVTPEAATEAAQAHGGDQPDGAATVVLSPAGVEVHFPVPPILRRAVANRTAVRLSFPGVGLGGRPLIIWLT